MFLLAIVAYLGSCFRKTFDICVEIVLGTAFGFQMDGVDGAVNMLKATIRRDCQRRWDGIKIPSSLSCRGIRMPAFPWFTDESFERAVKDLERFETRDDDVFVISYSKCGHHFIHEVLHMLISGEERLAPETKGTKFLEFFPRPLEYFEKMASPRVILTHLPYDLFPKHIIEGKCKIVRISRNPKDVFVSYYHHCLGIKAYFYEDSFNNFMRVQLDEPSDAEYGSYLDFERDYQVLSGRDHVLHITYEALRKTPLDTMMKLGKFLQLDHDKCFYEKVALATSFERVKADKDPKYKAGMKSGRSMYRRGVVGDWRNYVTLAMNEEIDAKIEQKWGGTPLERFFDYGD